MKRPLPLVLLLVLLGGDQAVRAYEPASTHAGMTERAALHGGHLHRLLTSAHGLDLGILEPLRLDLSRLPYLERAELKQHLRLLDPVHGYRPDKRLSNRSLGWIAAGAVLEAMPFARGRHHFLNPRNGKGLRNSRDRWGLALRMRVLDFTEGQGNFGGIWTGANFGLKGMSALRWARYRHNNLSLRRHLEHRFAALTGATRAIRHHHVALSLLTAGALLHLLQNMAVPALTRNDFVGTYLSRRSNIVLDRVSAYESFVRWRYGRTGVPKPTGVIPTFRRFNDFFANKAGTGLADRTQRRSFSLGSVPRPLKLTDSMTEDGVLRRVNRSVGLPSPRIRHLHLRHAARHPIYYRGPSGRPLLVYRIDSRGVLEFTLNRACYKATASLLVPEAVRYSAGLLRHLYRGRLLLVRQGQRLAILPSGPDLKTGTLIVLWQDRRGRRRVLSRHRTAAKRAGQALGFVSLRTLPRDAHLVAAAWKGRDTAGEPLVLGARWINSSLRRLRPRP